MIRNSFPLSACFFLLPPLISSGRQWNHGWLPEKVHSTMLSCPCGCTMQSRIQADFLQSYDLNIWLRMVVVPLLDNGFHRLWYGGWHRHHLPNLGRSGIKQFNKLRKQLNIHTNEIIFCSGTFIFCKSAIILVMSWHHFLMDFSL